MDQPAKRSWFGRHWWWFIPTVVLTPIMVCGGLVALIVTLVFGAIKSSDAYTQSLAMVQASPAMQTALGTPVEPGFFVTGNIHVSGASGEADLSYRVTGPQGTATIYVQATKSVGQWTIHTLIAERDKGKRTDLLQSTAGP
jgi:hypothetical protein